MDHKYGSMLSSGLWLSNATGRNHYEQLVPLMQLRVVTGFVCLFPLKISTFQTGRDATGAATTFLC